MPPTDRIAASEFKPPVPLCGPPVRVIRPLLASSVANVANVPATDPESVPAKAALDADGPFAVAEPPVKLTSPVATEIVLLDFEESRADTFVQAPPPPVQLPAPPFARAVPAVKVNPVPTFNVKLVAPSISAADDAWAEAGPAVAVPPCIVSDPAIVGLNEAAETMDALASALKSDFDAESPVCARLVPPVMTT